MILKNIYASSLMLFSYPPDESIKIIKDFGLDGIELWTQHLDAYPVSLNKIRETAQKNNVKILCHATSWDLNIASINPQIKNVSISEIKRSILMAKVIGSREITIHPGRKSFVGIDSKICLNNMLASLEDIFCFAQLHNMEVSVEIMENTPLEMIVYPRDVSLIISRSQSKTKITLDIAHLPDTLVLDEYFKTEAAISKVHISNRKKNTYHTPLDEGDIDIDGIIEKLIYLDIPLVIEGFDTDKNLKALNKNILKITSILNRIRG